MWSLRIDVKILNYHIKIKIKLLITLKHMLYCCITEITHILKQKPNSTIYF